MTKYLNLDKIVEEECKVEVQGRVFDLTGVPARKMTELMQLNQDINLEGLKRDATHAYEVFERENKALIDVLGEDQNGEAASYEWILENVSVTQLQKLIEFITNVLAGENGNFPAADQEIPGSVEN